METSDPHPLQALLDAFLKALPADAFRRKRDDVIWTPELTAIAVLVLVLERCGNGYEPLLTSLRSRRGDLLHHDSSPSTFCRARKKLTAAIREPAWQAFRRLFSQLLHDVLPLVRGQQLVALDGITLNARRSRRLFAATRRRKPGRPPKDPPGQPQILVVVLVDVVTRTPIAWERVDPGTGERAAAMRLLKHLTPDMILLADRGFPSRILLDQLIAAGVSFVMRMPAGSTTMNEVRAFIDGRGRDRLVRFALGSSKRSPTAILRLISIRPQHAGKRPEQPWILLTSLKRCANWPPQVIAQLYHERWAIETFFREMKSILNADHFHAYDLDGVLTELTMCMFAAALMSAAELIALRDADEAPLRWDDRRQRRANRANLATIVLTMITTNPQFQDVTLLLERELGCAAKHAKRRIPDRSYKRQCKSFYGKWKHGFRRKCA